MASKSFGSVDKDGEEEEQPRQRQQQQNGKGGAEIRLVDCAVLGDKQARALPKVRRL